jgi:xanthine dehydrogenase YagR molybdenum-binding subunit
MTITMTAPVGPNRLDKPGLVGQPMDRVDGRAKVTGRATYAYEVREPRAAAAYGYVVQSAIAKGRIAGIDTRAA